MDYLFEWLRKLWVYWKAVVFGLSLNAAAAVQYAVDVGAMDAVFSNLPRLSPTYLIIISLFVFLGASFFAFQDAAKERDAYESPNPKQFDVEFSGHWIVTESVTGNYTNLVGDPVSGCALVLRDCQVVNHSPHPVILLFSLWLPGKEGTTASNLILDLDQRDPFGRYKDIYGNGLYNPVRIGPHDNERGDLVFVVPPEDIDSWGRIDKVFNYSRSTLVVEGALSGVRHIYTPDRAFRDGLTGAFKTRWKGTSEEEFSAPDVYRSMSLDLQA